MNLSDALNHLAEGGDLSVSEAHAVFGQIMAGEASPPQIAGVLMALRTKGEVAAEVTGAAQAMRDASTKVNVDVPHLVDTCGTGGSGSNKLFNVSTAAAFVAAAGGAHVAKHGNRGASSKSGSADVLETAGLSLDLDPVQVGRCISEIGVGFLFAQVHHTAMRFAGPVRQALGVRTIFNMLGPLTNPASVRKQVIGVFSTDIQKLIANAAMELGSEHVMVVHSQGLDEFSVTGPTHVVELRDETIEEYDVHPSDFGMQEHDISSLRADTPEASLALIKQALSADQNPAARDLVALNSGAALYVSGVTTDLNRGFELAIDLISTGQANEKLKELVDFARALHND